MENRLELCHVVYHVLLNQIQFGAYHWKDRLPTIEETSMQLHVSMDTVRSAYLRLKHEGIISLSKNVGARVKVNYNHLEMEQCIQMFFASRKTAMLDLAYSMRPLFAKAQGIGLRYASSQTLKEIEQLSEQKEAIPPYAMLEHLNQKYSALGNPLLMRLVWQTFMFLHDPFFSLNENLHYFDQTTDYLPELLKHCQSDDESAVQLSINQSLIRLADALDQFYRTRITYPTPEKEIDFEWSSYKKSQQLRYSLAMDLLLSISRGVYPAGSLLPSQIELAELHGVGVNTVRRALELLSSIGAIKSAKYIGTRVLPFDQVTENSDFTKPVLQRRLLDMTESLQFLALSCHDVALTTLNALDASAFQNIADELRAHKQRRRGEVLSYVVLSLIADAAPYQAIRTIYKELLQQFFWAYALLGMNGSQHTVNAVYDPYFDDLIQMLEQKENLQFAARLEQLIHYEFQRTQNTLSKLNIPGADNILSFPANPA
ncbi:GntR family transcriptional regulator [Holdemania massiliensis]|uniref:GntR family transcriptional regulator n=1 Tax=Holdemania massiliensis TaxID=1468449 RepID=UPI001F052F71|nr:GntR family transcriptional regulator [Holdemania massiliensis]MCH1941877.1 GntR family transcriptional regulator [Holdemania massiliensis]